MNTAFKIVASLLTLVACMAALGTLASLLFDALRGTRDEFGPFGTVVLAALLVGQCRILWILVDYKTRRRVEDDDEDVVGVALAGSGTNQHA
jgi:hypothetical protein